ncbi:MAG TPA: hypothetical protein VF026_17405 [Ktedonobacteraceae bacterium]
MLRAHHKRGLHSHRAITADLTNEHQVEDCDAAVMLYELNVTVS